MTLLLQVVLGWLVGFGAMMLVPAPEGRELFVGAAGITAGVLLGAVLTKRRPTAMHAVATAAGAVAGALTIPLLPALGFQAVLIPLVFSILSFVAVTLLTRKRVEPASGDTA